MLNGQTYDYLTTDGVKDLPLAIPLRVISKAQSNKDSSHSIADRIIRELDNGVGDAVATILDPSRNSLLFITPLKQSDFPVAVSFEMDTEFDWDNVHKGTSIHLRTNLTSTLENLSGTIIYAGTIIYVKNKNELESLTKANILDRVQENNKLIDLTVSQNEDDVKNQSRDTDYLSAVVRGDMETAQRMVDEAADIAFADSKIRGKDGKMLNTAQPDILIPLTAACPCRFFLFHFFSVLIYILIERFVQICYINNEINSEFQRRCKGGYNAHENV